MSATKTRKKSSTKSTDIAVVICTFTGSDGMKFQTPRACHINEYTPITDEDYILEYGTPLLDATAKFINDLDELKKPGRVVIGCLADMSLSMWGNEEAVINGLNEFVDGMKGVEVDPESDGKVLAVIFTDGEELHSKEVSRNDLSALISDKEDQDWTFIYLGANQDAWLTGNSLGYGRNTSSVNWTATPQGTQESLRNVSNLASCYVSSNATYGAMQDAIAGGSTFNPDGSVTNSEGKTINIGEAISKAKESK